MKTGCRQRLQYEECVRESPASLTDGVRDKASVWKTRLNTKQFHGVLNKYPLLMVSIDNFMRFIITKPIGKILAEANDLQRGSVKLAKEKHPFQTKGNFMFLILFLTQSKK